jgi:hypothetical protein
MTAARYRPGTARRRRLAQIAVIIVIALGATAAGLALAGHHGARQIQQGPGRARPGVPPTSAAGSGWLARATRSGLAGLRWTDFYGVELPVSPSAGPRAVRRGLAWGFADTPAGALLAAVSIGVRANAQWGPAIFGPTIRDQVTGPGAAALVAACQASYDQASRSQGVPGGRPLGPVDVAEAAFRWVIYTPASATVDIVSVGPGGQGVTARAVTRIELQWLDGDWRVLAPPGGDWGNSAAPLTSLAGYTSFPARPGRKDNP